MLSFALGCRIGSHFLSDKDMHLSGSGEHRHICSAEAVQSDHECALICHAE